MEGLVWGSLRAQGHQPSWVSRSWAGLPVQTAAAAGGFRLSHQAAGEHSAPRGPAWAVTQRERGPRSPSKPPSPLCCSHSCSAEGSWEVGSRRASRGQASRPRLPARCSLCIWETLPRMGKLRLWERQGGPLFSAFRVETLRLAASGHICHPLWLQRLPWLSAPSKHTNTSPWPGQGSAQLPHLHFRVHPHLMDLWPICI